MNGIIILEFLARQGMAIGWGLILIVSLLVLFRFGIRKIEPRSMKILLTTLLVVISVGQFAVFYFYSIPNIKDESAYKVKILKEKISIIDLDNVTQTDLTIGYKKENATLSETVERLRARTDELETRIAGITGENIAIKRKATAYRDENSRLKRKVDSKGFRSGTRSKSRAKSSGTRSTSLGKSGKAGNYTVTILTSESNAARCKAVESSLKSQGFRLNRSVPIESDENRLIYYANTDEARAESIATLLQKKYNIALKLKLSPNQRRKNNFQIFLKP